MTAPLGPRRVLLVRLSAIGDVIHTMPVACAVRERFPETKLAWVVEARAGAVLRGHEAIDELIELPRGFLKSPREVWGLRHQLRAFGPDVAIDVQSLSKSALVAWISGAPLRIGFARPVGRELSPWCNNLRVRPTATHVVDQYLELLGPLGIRQPTVRFQVPETATERETADRLVRQMGLDGGYAILNAGAGWPSKRWPADRFAAVARYLGQSWHLPSLVLWAGTEERGWAEQIVAGSEGHAKLAPPTSLRELAALARQARLFVGCDTGPLHLAAAVGTPCVGLFGPWPAERNGPYGPNHIAIQKMRFEGPTRKRRTAPPIYMNAIDVASVCEACDKLLERDFIQAA
ncbi:MAG: glycosyltransferase family 9 protein [Thermoguttaceae bacterium]|jgi:lipopolysaccharide heptosyltransferase I|nr:glycosyltransferase family 9 protein [Thermoguttaceae bacterium]